MFKYFQQHACSCAHVSRLMLLHAREWLGPKVLGALDTPTHYWFVKGWLIRHLVSDKRKLSKKENVITHCMFFAQPPTLWHFRFQDTSSCDIHNGLSGDRVSWS
jgi:hypothetical protein